MGTELERRGMELVFPLWSARALIERPDLVFQIHRENVAGGADILTANTFRTQRGTLAAAGVDRGRAHDLTSLAVSLARRAAAESGREIVVAGSTAPLADCYRPDLVAGREVLDREHAAHSENLIAAGVDLVLIETMNTIREAEAAAGSLRGRVPFVVSFVTDQEGSLLSGEPLEEAAAAVLELGPTAIGINCTECDAVTTGIRRLQSGLPGLRIGAYANTLADGIAPDEYAGLAAEWVAAGARIIGGCCGTSPEHTAALRRALDREL